MVRASRGSACVASIQRELNVMHYAAADDSSVEDEDESDGLDLCPTVPALAREYVFISKHAFHKLSEDLFANVLPQAQLRLRPKLT